VVIVITSINSSSSFSFNELKHTTQFIPNIETFNLGFGEEPSRSTLYFDKEGSCLASLYARVLEHKGIHFKKNEEVQISTIDEFCCKNNIERIHYLKMDVEGNELNVLKGATKMINSGKISFIQFEFGGCNIDSRIYFKDIYYFLKDNFEISRILIDGLYKIPDYSEKLESFYTTNFLAEKQIS